MRISTGIPSKKKNSMGIVEYKGKLMTKEIV
jgi:hypothetical protein